MTKELKKKHSSRPIGGAEMGSWAERTHGKMWLADPARLWLADPAVPHFCIDKPGGIKWERKCNPKAPAQENKAPNY